MLGHVSLDGFQALELFDHVIGLRIADDRGPVFVPNLVGKLRQLFLIFIRFNGNESHVHKPVPFNKVRLFPHCNTRVSCSLQSVSQSVNNGALRKRPGQSVAISNA